MVGWLGLQCVGSIEAYMQAEKGMQVGGGKEDNP
jgi:hypothetical protein